ncbi:MAG TPA: ABC transporter permease [Dictyoglomaceae bacterium]|nr:ABC transporter permease [Dictyoglomaceae bacterium]
MENFVRYIILRIFQTLIVIFIGVTIVFFVPRLTPMDPVAGTINRINAYSPMDPKAVEKLVDTLKDLYGLKGNLLEQYIRFWTRLIKGDLGPSLAMFPTPVVDVINKALPWTIGLLVTSTIIAWLLGIILGTVVGYSPNKKWAQVISIIITCIYPVPYYIIALILVFIFAYIFPIFPLMGGTSIGLRPSFSFHFLFSLIEHGFLPAISLIIGTTCFIFMTQRALISSLTSSDFINFAEIAGLPHKKIRSYLIRNSMLPQITDLALSLGSIFGGALMTEFVFSYPGIGQILYSAILQADFNLIMGISIFSIIGVAFAALILDLIYPLLDPRIRYK